ncbi:MAG: hypothetical protein MUC41_01045 [Syntrophobacteraceae bacterium]|jgi:hypothetical protein|nr:hypothetical protein [Syntrophobacteraceae bacterium]
MSIRLIALELYNIMREVEALERKIQELPPHDQAGRAVLDRELRQAKSEQERIRKILEGAKSG